MRPVTRLFLLATSSTLAMACGDSTEVSAPDAGMSDAPTHATTTVFLNFDGVQITKGQPDDPATNTSIFVRPPGVTVAPWHDGMPGRDASIAAITAGARAIVAPYAIEVVTTRPTSGLYDMVVFGGASQDLFGAPGVRFANGADCNGRPEISFITELVTDDQVAASLVVAFLGEARLVPRTIASGDCMCLDSACMPRPGELCNIGGPGTPTGSLPLICSQSGDPPAPPTIDEHALFLDRFGAR